MEKNQILAIHGTNYEEMTLQILEASGLTALVPDKHARIGIKPNLVVAAPAQGGATTHPEIVEGVITYLKQNGYDNYCVLEGSWVGDRTKLAYKVSGIEAVCEKTGTDMIDLQHDTASDVTVKGFQTKICDKALELDFLINLPVLKGHCQTVMTCALKNHKGLIPNKEKSRFHTLGLHQPIGHLPAAFPNELIVCDNICGDLDFEEGGNPVVMNRILCGRDPVLMDAFACQVLGIDIAEVPYIKIAESLGTGTADVNSMEFIQLNESSVSEWPRPSRRVKELESYVEQKNACSACYGMLIHALDKLDKEDELYGHMTKIHIGQGYQDQPGEIGIGKCTAKHDFCCKGCPPTAAAILDFLKENWK